MRILIVVDMQNDFVTGVLGSEDAVKIIPTIKRKIDDRSYDLVVFTRDTHDDNYLETQEGRNLPVKHCIENTYGWLIVPELYRDDYPIINKHSFGLSNWKSELRIFEEEIDEIELCGVCTDICVVSNAIMLKTMYPEVIVSVDSSACAGTTRELHNAAINVMRSCQINVY